MSQVCVNISILEDANVENDETFTITLTTSDQAVLIGKDTAEITIVEDDDCTLYVCLSPNLEAIGNTMSLFVSLPYLVTNH